MKINGVDFNDTWVAKFETAEAFATHPSNQHLYPELKTVEARQDQLKMVWQLIVKPVQPVSHDSKPNDDKPKKAGRKSSNKSVVAGNDTFDGGLEPQADGEGGGQPGETDNLRGEDSVQSENSGA